MALASAIYLKLLLFTKVPQKQILTIFTMMDGDGRLPNL
jgi:hypothetical protein